MNKTWNGIDPPPDKGSNGDLRLYTKEMYYPKPRIAIHARYVAVCIDSYYSDVIKL